MHQIKMNPTFGFAANSFKNWPNLAKNQHLLKKILTVFWENKWVDSPWNFEHCTPNTQEVMGFGCFWYKNRNYLAFGCPWYTDFDALVGGGLLRFRLPHAKGQKKTNKKRRKCQTFEKCPFLPVQKGTVENAVFSSFLPCPKKLKRPNARENAVFFVFYFLLRLKKSRKGQKFMKVLFFSLVFPSKREEKTKSS